MFCRLPLDVGPRREVVVDYSSANQRRERDVVLLRRGMRNPDRVIVKDVQLGSKGYDARLRINDVVLRLNNINLEDRNVEAEERLIAGRT